MKIDHLRLERGGQALIRLSCRCPQFCSVFCTMPWAWLNGPQASLPLFPEYLHSSKAGKTFTDLSSKHYSFMDADHRAHRISSDIFLFCYHVSTHSFNMYVYMYVLYVV